MVEMTFGGLTSRLWDDPFEWTLAENLGSREKILEYLDEVESTRRKGFAFVGSDNELNRIVPAPSNPKSLVAIILDALTSSEHYQGRAFAVFQMISNERLPRL